MYTPTCAMLIIVTLNATWTMQHATFFPHRTGDSQYSFSSSTLLLIYILKYI